MSVEMWTIEGDDGRTDGQANGGTLFRDRRLADRVERRGAVRRSTVRCGAVVDLSS